MRVIADRANRLHFALPRTEPDAIVAWRDHVRWLLDGRAVPPTSPAFLLDCLLHLDGIATVADLRAAWAALDDAYRVGKGPAYIEWTDTDGRLQRRQLSAITLLSLSVQASRSTFDTAVRLLVQSWPRDPASDAATDEEHFMRGAERVQAALVLMISGDLAGHVVGRQPLTALSRACLVRRATERPLALAVSHPQGESLFGDDDGEPAIDALDLGLLDAIVNNNDGSIPAALVEKIIEACQPRDADGSASAGRRRAMLLRLRDLAAACEAGGAWVAVFLLFATHLVKVGTRHTRPLAPRTIPEYLGHCLRQLAARLADVSLKDAATLAWTKTIYAPALDDPNVPDGQRGKLGAAFTAFHDLLCSVLGVAPLDKRLTTEGSGPLVQANIVWPHETRLALDWLTQLASDDRLLAQARAVLTLLAAGAFRFEDAFHVHLAGFRVDDQVLRIAIDPLPSAGDGKTPAARRHVEITDVVALETLTAWRDRRLDEGAMPRDLLFGDPLDGRRHFRRGATLGVLNALLKAASGDEGVGTHELRHAFLSLARERMDAMDQRRLDSASSMAGHEWTSTTLTAYCHLYESPLRRQLDSAIRQIDITERAACQLTGQRPGVLRKRWQRAQRVPSECIGQALGEAADAVALKDAEQWHPTGLTANPLKPGLAPLRYGKVLLVLCDLAAGRSNEAIALRHGLTVPFVNELIQAARSWHGAGACRTPARDGARAELPWPDQWARGWQARWATVRRRLEATRADSLRPVLESWAAVARHQHLDLDRLQLAHPLLQWLAGVGITGEQMVLCQDADSPADPAVELIAALSGVPPRVRRTRPRRGRPKTYLMLTSRPDSPSATPPNAALSIAGLHVLLFAAWVWSRRA